MSLIVPIASDHDDESHAEIAAALRQAGLIAPGVEARFVPLTGGVASDIWKIETGGRPFVVKRARPRLKVATEWFVPVGRNAAEAGWFRVVRAIVPSAVPDVLFHSREAGLFAMPFFPPERYPVWKSQLRDGHVDLDFTARAGSTLAKIHATTVGDAALAAEFANDAIFHAIRLEAYLETTARRHPDLADQLMRLSRDTLACHQALVHGDISPKNILVGPDGPLFLDAECAWYGDPAFDVAFCLKHFLLKCLWTPAATPRFLAAFDTFSAAYLGGLPAAVREEIETRTARLLPGLFLARVDGKSPVEYVTAESDRDLVRRTARPLLRAPPARIAATRHAWADALNLRDTRTT